MKVNTPEPVLTALAEEQKGNCDFSFARNTIKAHYAMDTSVEEPKADLFFTVPNFDSFKCAEYVYSQVGQRLKIPTGYIQRMRRLTPELLLENVTEWLQMSNEPVLLRTNVTGENRKLRAFLDCRKPPVDHLQVLPITLNCLQNEGYSLEAISFTETNLGLTALHPTKTATVAPNDIVRAGMLFRNSETGHGDLNIMIRIWRRICTNGMVAPLPLGRNTSIRKEFLKNPKTRDLIIAKYIEESNKHADKLLGKIQQSVKFRVQDPIKAIEYIGKRYFHISKKDIETVVDSFNREPANTKWGIINAFTLTARHLDFEEASHYESLGSGILDLPNSVFDL